MSNSATIAPQIATAPTHHKLPYAVQVAPATTPAFIMPACFEGDDILPSDSPGSKVAAIGNVLLVTEEQDAALRPLSQAWFDAVRFHPTSVRQLADLIEHNLRAAAAIPPAQRPDTAIPQARPFQFDTVELDKGVPLVLRATNKRVHVGWDPRQITHAEAVGLFHMCAADAGVDTTGVTFPAPDLTEVAEAAAVQAVTASLAGVDTNPHDVADRLHRAVDRAQAAHLAEVGNHSPEQAYASTRFHSVIQAMTDAMEAAPDKDLMAVALRTALDMVIREAR